LYALVATRLIEINGRKVANVIEFNYGVPDEERAKLFQIEQVREAEMLGDGHKAA
jgi:hypothetical protein